MEDNINIGNPWKGLSSYTYQDADRFYGRDQELKDIASVIKQNAFTTLYGISGAGKTSIINAGLFPLLDKQSFLPIYIRLDHNAGHVPYDIQIIKAVDTALLSIGAESEDIVGSDVESELDKLWLYFHSHRFWSKNNHIINPIIFIDQFEEIFTKNDDTDNIWSFFNIIDSLQYSTPTERILRAIESSDKFVSFGEEQNFRMVFSMREDFLARLEDYSYNIPALRKNRIGLKPLNGLQALEVILKPRPDVVTRKVALHIISKVIGKPITDNERKLEATSVDTSILSLFCTELYNYAMSDNKGEISIPLVDLYGGNILEWFYDRNMQILPKQTYVYMENQLLTHSGFRNSVALENLLENGVLQEQLDRLEENRIIRIEDVNHNLRVEFTHDVLCRIAKKRKDERDAIEKMKGEKAARRAFTIDNVILFSVFTFALLAIYYAGLNKDILFTLLSLPFIAFLYMIIANRTVADKNLSNTIWFIITCIAIEGGGCAGLINLEDTLNSNEAIVRVYVSFCISILSFLPIGIILMPFAILNKKEFCNKYQCFKDLKTSSYVYIAFLLAQSFLLGCWSYYFFDREQREEYLFPFLLPSFLLTLSPAYILWKNVKQKASKTLSSYTFAYTVYIVFVSLIIWWQTGYRILPSGDSHANVIAILVIWGVIGILCAFYAIQYMKQPKKQNFTDYYEKVLSFQAFTKYKSFKPRLYTILICFAIFLMGIIAIHYIDILPFFTLPVACILALHVGCSEFKLTKQKTAFSYKCIVPIFLLTEIIVGCQYIIGGIKMFSIYTSAILIVLQVLYHLLNNELLRNRKLFTIRVFVFSVCIGFLLPMVCIGYNIFNTSLFSVSRVWNGAISSDARSIYFMTIEDADGNVGVMDYSEIIVEPQYQRVIPSCSINTNIVSSVYPFRRMLMEMLDIPSYKVSCYGNDAVNDSHSGILSFRVYILSFDVVTNDGAEKSLSDLYFLGVENKYGNVFVRDWISTYRNLSQADISISEILSISNKCISDKDRNAAFVRLFIREMSALLLPYGNNYEFENVGAKSIRIYDSDNDHERLLKVCYNKASLSSLLDNSNLLSREQVYKTVINSTYLFKADSQGDLEHLILDELWDKLHSDSTERIVYDDKSMLMLICGNKEGAEQFASACLNKSPNDINSLINYCMILYCNGKLDIMQSTLHNYKIENKDSWSDNILIRKLSNKIHDLEECIMLNEEDKDKIISYFDVNGLLSSENYQRMISGYNEEVLIAAESTKVLSFNFETSDAVIIEVRGDGGTDVDVFVYGENQEEITRDTAPTDNCSCEFIPREGIEYSVEIRNLDDYANLCKIRIYQP